MTQNGYGHLQELNDRALTDVKSWYNVSIPESVFMVIQHLQDASAAYDIASFLFKTGDLLNATSMVSVGETYVSTLSSTGIVLSSVWEYVREATEGIRAHEARRDYQRAADVALDVAAALHVIYTYELVGRMKS